MRNLDKSEQAFLELYKAGLWGTEMREELFEDKEIDWERVSVMAREQTVVGIVGMAMSRLPNGRVPRTTYLRFLSNIKTIEDSNDKMNAFIPVLFKTLDDLGVRTWLLKGQGVGQNYADPRKRQPGDIDVFFPVEEEYERARKVFLTHLKPENVYADTPSTKTLEFAHRGIYVELHGKIVAEVNRKCYRHFEQFKDGFCHVETPRWNGAALPPVDFDAVFIFVHMVRHYFGGGIGLRQVSDWMRFMQAHEADIDRELLVKNLDFLGIRKLWQAFAQMAVGLLGCPVDAMPLADSYDSRRGRRLLRYVLESGNFGYYDKRIKSNSKFYYVRRFRAFWGHLLMKFRNFTMFPAESVYGIPSLIADGLKRT